MSPNLFVCLLFDFDKKIGVYLKHISRSFSLKTIRCYGCIHLWLIIVKYLKTYASFLQILFVEIVTAWSHFCYFPYSASPHSGICFLFTEPNPQTVNWSDYLKISIVGQTFPAFPKHHRESFLSSSYPPNWNISLHSQCDSSPIIGWYHDWQHSWSLVGLPDLLCRKSGPNTILENHRTVEELKCS
jgi:hypothetical protein